MKAGLPCYPGWESGAVTIASGQLCQARREVQVGVLIDARELFQAVRELAELGRQTCKVARAKEARVIDARPIFLALKVGIPRSALQQGRDKDI